MSNLAAPRRPSGNHVERLDLIGGRIIHIEDRFIRREAKPIGLAELVAPDRKIDVAPARRDAVHALEVATNSRLMPIQSFHRPIIGVGEVDGAIGADDHIMGLLR